MLGRDGTQVMAASHPSFYPSLHSMWSNSFSAQNSASAAAPALTPTSSSASPPTSRPYEITDGNASPEHQMTSSYGYPPTPPKEVKAEDNYFSGSGVSGGQASDTYSLPSPSATPTSSSYDMYASYAASSIMKKGACPSKNKNPNAGRFEKKQSLDTFL